MVRSQQAVPPRRSVRCSACHAASAPFCSSSTHRPPPPLQRHQHTRTELRPNALGAAVAVAAAVAAAVVAAVAAADCGRCGGRAHLQRRGPRYRRHRQRQRQRQRRLQRPLGPSPARGKRSSAGGSAGGRRADVSYNALPSAGSGLVAAAAAQVHGSRDVSGRRGGGGA
ncbi:hypothetical protein PLESTB_000636600 [Pleodorina starrii]|uniref:Uncharacterized protein n=1 Tax=Pleodorina starrii TaxID=330485 RepID=A0A9W6F1N4_9CHLO|nr:hypothetical protein PLESTB_000636600 [Pleodorina starrii]